MIIELHYENSVVDKIALRLKDITTATQIASDLRKAINIENEVQCVFTKTYTQSKPELLERGMHDELEEEDYIVPNSELVGNISVQGVGIVMIGESYEDAGLEVLQHYGDNRLCDMHTEGGCADDGILWSGNDMGSPYFCTNHFFPQEQLGYEFIKLEEGIQ